MFAGKPLSWVRDNVVLNLENAWGARHRDLFIVDPLSRKIEVYNLDDHPLTDPDNKATLKSKLLAAATPVDSDNDKLPDYWEKWAFGNLSRSGNSVLPDGRKVLLHYAHCSLAPTGGGIPGLPRIVAIPVDGEVAVSVIWTGRRGTAFGLTLTPEFSNSLGTWTTAGHGYEDWSIRSLYDGSGGEIIEWRSTTANPFHWARVKASLP